MHLKAGAVAEPLQRAFPLRAIGTFALLLLASQLLIVGGQFSAAIPGTFVKHYAAKTGAGHNAEWVRANEARAMERSTVAVARAPGDPDHHDRRGLLLMNKLLERQAAGEEILPAEAAEAEASLKNATQLRPNFSPSWTNLGLLRYWLTKDEAAARAAYLRAMQTGPGDRRASWSVLQLGLELRHLLPAEERAELDALLTTLLTHHFNGTWNFLRLTGDQLYVCGIFSPNWERIENLAPACTQRIFGTPTR